MDPNRACVVYASDARYAEILGISLTSLLDCSRDMEEIVIYILDGGISPEDRERIRDVCREYHRAAPVWIMAQDISSVLSMKVNTDRGSLSQYARLFISSDLPEHLDRILYLDCDTVFRKSVRDLWNLDLHGKTVGALLDAFSPSYRRNIGLQKNDIMFNSGVMLIDLNRWKLMETEDKLLRFISSRKGIIQQGDQGALNAVLSHDTSCFDPWLNSVTIFYDFSYDEMIRYRKPPEGFYREEAIKKAVDDPSVIHFTSSVFSKRPWEEGCIHRYKDLWLEYKGKSPWKEIPLRQDPSKRKNRQLAVLSKLPRKLVISIAGILQAYGKPLWYRMLSL